MATAQLRLAASEEATPSLVSIRATSAQQFAALILCIALAALTLVALSWGKEAAVSVPTFIPLWASVTGLADLLAALFILQQFAASRLTIFAGIGAAYALSGLLTLEYLFCFPGTFVATRALVGNEQSAIWLWVAWHLGFPLIVGWALFHDRLTGEVLPERQIVPAIRVVVGAVVVAAALAWWICIEHADALPPLVTGGQFQVAFRWLWAPAIVVVDLAVAATLWRLSGGRTLLYLALVVALVTAACDAGLNIVSAARYSPSWYIGKLESFLTAAIVLTALFNEISCLYRLVQERDKELQLANRSLSDQNREVTELNAELDSFSYSVSHDLRAPLRAFAGYLEMLDEDYADRLDDEGRRMIGVLTSEARRMDQLIIDLLEFARLGREPLRLDDVDMSALVASIVAEERRRAQRGDLTIRVGPLPPAQADPSLVQHVWQNLIANALKYSGKREGALVSIDGDALGGETIYRIADNGAGFDMAGVGRLFGVFQRLHSASDFPGTGVGLAIVRRIVTRHGGRIWAEGKRGEGATFWFTLPRSEARRGIRR